MNSIELRDCNMQIQNISKDLKAISSVMLTIEDHEEYANAHEALLVFHRALESIIKDIEETIRIISKEVSG